VYDSPTLKAIHMEWLARFFTVQAFLLLGGIGVGLVAGFFGHSSNYLALGAGVGFLTSFLVTALYLYIFYNIVRCPLELQRETQ